VDTVLDTADTDIPPTQRQVLCGLRRLRDRRDVFYRQPASVYVEEIIESLALRADANECVSDVGPAQRVTNLDALVEILSEWEGDKRYSPAEVTDLIEPFRESPDDGPTQPSTTGEAYDVKFQTVHRAKGDEDDVVVIADPGFNVWSRGPHTQRFVTQGSIVGLAPPTNTNIPEAITLPPFEGGLYKPPGGWDRDTGLRWATAHWSNIVCESADRDELVGPDRLSTVAANERAEVWRLLYVAMTRARDHLVVPLPHSDVENDHLRDRWLDTIRDGLEFGKGGTDSYTLGLNRSDPNGEMIDVGVNDVDLFTQRNVPALSMSNSEVSEIPPRRDDLEVWLPRFLNPSTMYPLTENLDKHTIAHLLGEPLHTDAHDVPDDLPLSFDQVGPDGVGRCLHAVLTELVTRGISEQSLQTMGSEVRRVFDDVVADTVPDVNPDESDRMYAFFEHVLTGFLNTELWEQIEDPRTTVGVEQPIDGLVKLDGVEFEIHGQTDFVIEYPDGERVLTDVKIALAEPTAETRQRYELQIAAYAYLTEQTEKSDTPVRGTIETLGVTTETTTSSWPPDIVQSRLQRLISEPDSSHE
jgi:ATP-dependent helicase/nuclease subunit A